MIEEYIDDDTYLEWGYLLLLLAIFALAMALKATIYTGERYKMITWCV